MRTRRVRDVSTKEKNHRAIVNSCNKQTSRLRYVMTKYLQSADTQEGKPINARGRHVMPRSACPADFFNFRAATDLVSEWRSLDRHLLARQAAANYNDCECVYCLHGRRDGSEKYRRLAGGSRVNSWTALISILGLVNARVSPFPPAAKFLSIIFPAASSVNCVHRLFGQF